MKHGLVTLKVVTDLSFEQVATQYYAMLYRFALSLTQREAEALDLVQQTFYLWTAKGHQLRDSSKLKSWLFTTLYREHLRARRRESVIRSSTWNFLNTNRRTPPPKPSTTATRPEFARVGGTSTVAWSKDGLTYLVLSKASEQSLRKRL